MIEIDIALQLFWWFMVTLVDVWGLYMLAFIFIVLLAQTVSIILK